MPIDFGGSITQVVFNSNGTQIYVNGTGFGENQYPVSNIEYSTDAVSWTAVDNILSWSDMVAVGSVIIPLVDGESYYVRITSSDNNKYETSSPTEFNSLEVSGVDKISIGISIGIGL